MIMRAQSLLEGDRHPSRQDIRDYMQTNLCRCGTHMRILAAVERAAAYLRGEKLPEVVR
jgi:aerobic-type carbon monoxide dehydrogenase small subunit (CoxS/CutS family)